MTWAIALNVRPLLLEMVRGLIFVVERSWISARDTPMEIFHSMPELYAGSELLLELVRNVTNLNVDRIGELGARSRFVQ